MDNPPPGGSQQGPNAPQQSTYGQQPGQGQPGYGQESLYAPPPMFGQQPSYQQPGYQAPSFNLYEAQPYVEADRRSGVATAGFVLGLLSLVAWLLPICGYPVTIGGILCGAMGLSSTRRSTLAAIGLVLSILALVATLVNSYLGVLQALHR